MFGKSSINFVRNLFEHCGGKKMSQVAEEVQTVVNETVQPQLAKSIKFNGTLASDTLTFGWKAPNEQAIELIKKYNENMQILRDGGASETVIHKFATKRQPVHYSGNTELSEMQQKGLKKLDELKESRELDKELEAARVASKRNALLSQRAENSKRNHINTYLTYYGNYGGTDFATLIKMYPELREANALKEMLSNAKHNIPKHEIMCELAKVVDETGNESLRTEMLSQINKEINNLIKQGNFENLYLSLKQKILFSKDKQALAKEMEETLSMVTEPKLRSNYLQAIGSYAKEHPSDLSFIDVLNQSIQAKNGNNLKTIRYAQRVLSEFDGQYYHLKDMYRANMKKDDYNSLIRSFINSAKTESQKKDCINYFNELVKDTTLRKSILDDASFACVFEPKKTSWFFKNFLKPQIEMSKEGELFVHTTENYETIAKEILVN